MNTAQMVFIAYVFCLIIPPLVGAMFFTIGTSENGIRRAFHLSISAFMILLWMPLLMVAPQMFISYFYS